MSPLTSLVRDPLARLRSLPPGAPEERVRKKEAREPHKRSAVAKKLIGLKAKLYAKKRHSEKITMKKTRIVARRFVRLGACER